MERKGEKKSELRVEKGRRLELQLQLELNL